LGDRESGDKIESEKSRDFLACEVQVANYCQTQDWLAGCLAEDRTHTFPIEKRPLKSQENFGSFPPVQGLETFGTAFPQFGRLEGLRRFSLESGCLRRKV
jgi:hypothetical protein